MGSSVVFSQTGEPRQALHMESSDRNTDEGSEAILKPPTLAYMMKNVEGDFDARKKIAANLDKLADSSAVVQEFCKQICHESTARHQLLVLQLPHDIYLAGHGFLGRSRRKPRDAAAGAADAGPQLYLEPLEAHHLRSGNPVQTVVEELLNQLKQLRQKPNLVGASLVRCDGLLRRNTTLNNGAEAVSHGAHQAARGVGTCAAAAGHVARRGVLNTLLWCVSDACGHSGVIMRMPNDQPVPPCRCLAGLSLLLCPLTAVIVGCHFCFDDRAVTYFPAPINGWYA